MTKNGNNNDMQKAPKPSGRNKEWKNALQLLGSVDNIT